MTSSFDQADRLLEAKLYAELKVGLQAGRSVIRHGRLTAKRTVSDF